MDELIKKLTFWVLTTSLLIASNFAAFAEIPPKIPLAKTYQKTEQNYKNIRNLMFSGKTSLNLDSKGRLAIPSRYRARLQEMCGGNFKVTANPFGRSVWIYPLCEWELVEAKLIALPASTNKTQMKKTLMIGHAEDCTFDSQGRIRLESSLIEHGRLEKNIVIFGQGNKFEVWNEAVWNAQYEQWLDDLGDDNDETVDELRQLVL